MRKRKPLEVDALAESVAARSKVKGGTLAPSADQEEYSGSAVNLRKSDWKFLRRVAEARAEREGGRPSVSKVVEGLIDANRKRLESEVM